MLESSIASLGYKVGGSRRRRRRSAVEVCGLRYDVTFTPDKPVFRLPRKLAREKLRRPVPLQSSDSRRVIGYQQRAREVHPGCLSADGLFLVKPVVHPDAQQLAGPPRADRPRDCRVRGPGFKGTLTLGFTNLTRVPIVLWPGKPIAQLSFMTLDRPAERPYGHPELGIALPGPGRRDREPLRGRAGPAIGSVGSRPMVHALLVLAAEEAEPSKTAFYVFGGALAVWAVVLGVIGLRSPEFPGSERGERGVMAISAVLVVAAMAAAVLTS